MARMNSPVLPLVVALAAAAAICHLAGVQGPAQQPAFLPAPPAAAKAGSQLLVQPGTAAQAAYAAALAAAATAPLPVTALEEDEEGFDVRILAVVALPLGAISWALFNVWRVAFRQVVRIGESTSGSSKIGLRRDD
eukprot:CAMPEP_0197874622 /NCGR_PEP_ID=MMETSP1439-20131203/4094_1 /TAXON_ID=66791 /ORGANISM="Gonyaulax spinifera, Strain CCMP409" /LENGTH=135 /DNA_ID=CAMNT_0043493765 /DNA_START=88 /DNA_END=495 /DNA_ORIENTATION=+